MNRWILSSGEFDGVIDFAAGVANPSAPNELAAAFDSGDGLHPNSAGYQRMADIVDLSSLHCPHA